MLAVNFIGVNAKFTWITGLHVEQIREGYFWANQGFIRNDVFQDKEKTMFSSGEKIIADVIGKFRLAAQLIKHILGLKAYCGNNDFRLLYLWYDVLGKEGADHRAEVEDFTTLAKSDGVHFHAMTYQELIVILDKYYRNEHSDYIKYITERYN